MCCCRPRECPVAAGSSSLLLSCKIERKRELLAAFEHAVHCAARQCAKLREEGEVRVITLGMIIMLFLSLRAVREKLDLKLHSNDDNARTRAKNEDVYVQRTRREVRKLSTVVVPKRRRH